MTVTLTHTQVKTITSGALFQVVDTVTASTGIGPAVFVFTTDSQLFNRVATAADMQTYPDTRATALTDGLGYYRLAAVTYAHADLSTVRNFVLLLNSRLLGLCREQDQLAAGFTGTLAGIVVTS